MMWMLLQGVLLILCFGMQCVSVFARDGFNDGTCVWNVSTPKFYIEKIPSAFLSLQDGPSLSFSFSVTACNDAIVILSRDEAPRSVGSYEIAIGGWGNKKSAIYRFSHEHENVNTTSGSPLSCTEPRSFYVSWENQVLKVGKVDRAERSVAPSVGSYLGTEGAAKTSVKVNGRWQSPFLTYRETSWNATIRHVFVNNNNWGSGAKWQIDVPCEPPTDPPQTENPATESSATEDAETEALLTELPRTGDDKTDAVYRQGLFTIPVVGAVVGGLAAGACVMYTGLRLCRKCREKTPAQKRKGEARNIELSELGPEQLQIKNKAQASDKDVSLPRLRSDMLLDLPPPHLASQKSTEVNTDYILMSGTSAPSSAAKHLDDVKLSDVQKPVSVSVSSRAMTPLPQVPFAAAETSQSGKYTSRTGKLTSQEMEKKGPGRRKYEAVSPPGLYANEDIPPDHVYEKIGGDLYVIM